MNSRAIIGGIGLCVLACVNTPVGMKKVRFFPKGELCVSKGEIAREYVYPSFWSNKNSSISVKVADAIVAISSNQSFGSEYYRDVARFISEHPDATSEQGDLVVVNFAMRSPSEAKSLRLFDRLIVGDGSMRFLVSKSIMGLLEESGDKLALEDIYFVLCDGSSSGRQSCERRFPYQGFLASYRVEVGPALDVERDGRIRRELKAVAGPC